MSTAQQIEKPRVKRKKFLLPLLAILVVALVGAAVSVHFLHEPEPEPQPEPEPEPLEVRTMYIASDTETAIATVYDADGQPHELTLIRGAEVQRVVEKSEDDALPRIVLDEAQERFAFVPEENLAPDREHAVTTKTVYARRAVNLLDDAGVTPGELVTRGQALTVTGFEGLDDSGAVARWQVEGGYLPAELTALTEAEATAVSDPEALAFHTDRGDPYGGGEAGELDFEPYAKPRFADNVMPDEVKALYLNVEAITRAEDYIAIAKSCGINAFVVDIMDGGAIGYQSPVMQAFSPSAYAGAYSSVERYQTNVAKLKEAGYYVIGRITAFNDPNLAVDRPECVISDLNGNPLKVVGMYWPSVYDRRVWQYKVDLALEAVELMGFNEIQFDYMRFPDGAWKYEQAGTIDYHNAYGESKAQAVQRFLAYAARRLHDKGAYISCDVFGECAFGYVTAYGQYWPAMSAVVDAISAMPYPDHYPATGDYRPWEHPYDTVLKFAQDATARQTETPGEPAAVRTWIQAYNAIREPYPRYGPDEVGAEIKALHDGGCTGGYMTWNAGSSVEKYWSLAPAFE
ncbi:MAG: hypothetical protein II458_05330 [Oscillospiraceae bacterium]|nr:hypothetical protein [Oscillospiraceae bacterium]